MDIRELINDTEGRDVYPATSNPATRDGSGVDMQDILDRLTALENKETPNVEYKLEVPASSLMERTTDKEVEEYNKGVRRYSTAINLVKTEDGTDTTVSTIPILITNKYSEATHNGTLAFDTKKNKLVFYNGTSDLRGNTNRYNKWYRSLNIVRVLKIKPLNSSTEITLTKPLVMIGTLELYKNHDDTREPHLSFLNMIVPGEIHNGSDIQYVTYDKVHTTFIKLMSNDYTTADPTVVAPIFAGDNSVTYAITSADIGEILNPGINPNILL